MEPKIKEKYFFYGLLALAAVFCLFIFWPFLTIIAMGAALAVVLHPIFLWIKTHLRIKINGLAALLAIIIFLLVLAVPLTFIGTNVVGESHSFYVSLTQGGAASQFIDNLSATLHRAFPATASYDIKNRLGDIAGFFAGSFANIFTATLQTVFSFVLIVLSLFYFLKDGDRWKQAIVELSPLSKEHDDRLIAMLSRAINGVLTGYVFVGILQGTLLGIGLWIFGVPNPALWGVLASIASLVPPFGTSLVSVPSIIYLFATGKTTQGIGLIIWALMLIGLIDNFLSPMIVSKKIDLPPFVALFAILGGVSLVGASGILIGPLAVSLFYALIRIYREDFGVRQ